MNLAAKDVRYNAGRFALTTVGVGMLLMVVMGMGGIYRGIVEDATLLVDQIGADVWIVQRGTRGPFAEISRLPPSLLHRARAVPGVQSARQFVFHTVQRERDGKPLRIAVLGLSWPTDKGEWLPLVAGRPLARSRYETIADVSLGLQLGESLALGKERYTVVGLTEGMLSSAGDGIGFFTVPDAQAIQFDQSGEAVRLERAAREARGERSELGASQPFMLEQASKPVVELPAIAPPQIGAVMLRVGPGANAEDVAAIVSGWRDVTVHTHAEQREFLLGGAVEKVRRQIGLFRMLLTAIAAVVMALILYTMTLDKLQPIALLKLIGAPNRVILGMILQQALVLGALGFAIAWLVGQRLFPRFPRRVVLTEGDLAELAAIVLAISIVSSLLGMWKAARVSPNQALSG